MNNAVVKKKVLNYEIMHGTNCVAEINTRGEAVFENAVEWKVMFSEISGIKTK